MRHHLWGMSQYKPWVVPKRHGHVANLHPALRLPAQKFNFIGFHVVGSYDRGRAIVLFEMVVHDQAALLEIVGHWCTRVWRGMLDIGPVDVLTSERKIGFDRFARVIGIADDQSSDYIHPMAMQIIDRA